MNINRIIPKKLIFIITLITFFSFITILTYNKVNQIEHRIYQEHKQINEPLTDFSQLKLLSEIKSNSHEQSLVNPYYNQFIYKYSHNCACCSAAYDLRKRGYDVEACANFKNNPFFNTKTEMASWYDNSVWIDFVTLIDNAGKFKYDKTELKNISNRFSDELLKYGDGARGYISITWINGKGHSVIWEIENGNVIIRDCQNNKTYNSIYKKLKRSKSISYMRTDNLQPTNNILKVVRNK